MQTLEEVRAIADKLNIKYHHKAGIETIQAQINQQGVARVDDAMKHPAEKSTVKVAKFNTQQEVLDVIAPFLEKGMTVEFDDEEKTWLFKYKGREECGNMSVLLRDIRNKAENVSKGRLAPRGFNEGKEVVLWA